MRAFSAKFFLLLLSVGAFVLVLVLTAGATSEEISKRSTRDGARIVLGKDPDLPMIYRYRVLKEYHHDPTAFTQGLLHEKDDILLESTGHYGRSTVRRVDLNSGRPIDVQRVPEEHFAEGLHLHKGKLHLLTWKSPFGMTFERKTLSHTGNFSTGLKDGWGLTGNGTHLIATDSGSSLFYLNPTTLTSEREVPVTFNGKPVRWLNELEFIGGEVWANIFMRECVARINPESGKVRGWVLLHGLRQNLLHQRSEGHSRVDVLNGIAWDGVGQRLFVTGKYWPKLYELKVYEAGTVAPEDLAEMQRLCLVPTGWNV